MSDWTGFLARVAGLRALVLVGVSLSLLGCRGGETAEAPAPMMAATPPPVPGTYDAHPEPPAILRDIALIDDDVNFTQPFVPGHRTTMDGRVALRVQGGPPGADRLAKNLSFYLFVPERLEAPILPGPPGPQILGSTTPWDVPFSPAFEPTVTRMGHHAICDPTTEFSTEGERPNPYACGPDDTHDCYDITVINTTSDDRIAQLWGTPVTVEVAQPKTPAAAIVNVTMGTPVAGTHILFASEFMEPVVTIDGRLLTGRLGRFPRYWVNPETGEELMRPYDIVYSQLPEDARPCDVTEWIDFHPMSHAPYDPRMVGVYGVAAYPFRDTEGVIIPDGEDMGGTYPWLDREGANVFMTGVHGRIVEQPTDAFPRTCVVEGCENYTENNDWDRGFMVGGLWTHGKMVHLDFLINNIDWAVGVTPDAHWWVDLYRKADGEAVPVRFGSGRFVMQARREGGPYPGGYTQNANILDSLQNLANWQPNAVPVTPRDVVWVMSSGVATDEIAFDDLLDPNAFIVSNMQASITQLYDEVYGSLSIPHHHNGEKRKLNESISLLTTYDLVPDQRADIHLQNGATSLRWAVPAYGLVKAGTGRVEPVALGGVKGRGFWLSGTNEIRYAVPAQPRAVRETPWTVGLYLDPRYAAEEVHTLMTWPDGSGVRLKGRSAVQLVRGDEPVHEVALPETEGWIHLGLHIAAASSTVTVLLDGLPLDRWTASAPIFEMTEGDFVVGRAGEVAWGFRGWIDNLLVLAHDVDPEVACNHAGGTLIRVTAGPWMAVAERAPEWAHDTISAAAGDAKGARYACFTDHKADYAAHLANVPAEAVSVREAIIFPEGPIKAGAPRPDSSENAFCLTCHTADGRDAMGLDALSFEAGVMAEDDERRQPSQPPRRVFGNIPAGWIPPAAGPGSPLAATKAPREGALIDRWVLPTAE